MSAASPSPLRRTDSDLDSPRQEKTAALESKLREELGRLEAEVARVEAALAVGLASLGHRVERLEREDHPDQAAVAAAVAAALGSMRKAHDNLRAEGANELKTLHQELAVVQQGIAEQVRSVERRFDLAFRDDRRAALGWRILAILGWLIVFALILTR
jgi:sensor domain CHASE-containing protein